MSVFEKIAAQQGKERSAVWLLGEQLKDLLRCEPEHREMVERDLELPAMSLAECEKKIKAYADQHRTGNFACVTPAEAEEIIRSFYGLPPQTAPVRETNSRRSGKRLDLKDFL